MENNFALLKCEFGDEEFDDRGARLSLKNRFINALDTYIKRG